MVVGAEPERQSQAPITLLGYHPVVHVAQPIKLSLESEPWNPSNLARHIHHWLTQGIHRDEPLLDKTKDQLSLTSPTCRIPVSIVMLSIEQTFRLESGDDVAGHFLHVSTSQPAEPGDVGAVLI